MNEGNIEKSIEYLKNLSYSLGGIYSEEIELLEEMCNEQIFKVAVIGEFSVGKSTFLNALIGKRILYSSSNEATGTITIIENNESKKALIYFEDNSYKQVDLAEEQSYLKLKNFLDIHYKGKKLKQIVVKYPFKGVDKDVMFLDTPGLQGISKEQLNITKEAIKEANATIIVINKKGLTKTELDLICGRNKDFGKINTKEVFIVINRIGEIFESNSKEYAEEKVNEVIDEVKTELERNGFKNNKIFALDSLDYLWGQDVELYQEIYEANDKEVKTILAKEEYIKRSNYLPFKKYLFDFLESSNRQKAFLEDIKEKMSILVNEFESIINSKYKNSAGSFDESIHHLNIQKELILKSRRKFINTLRRQLTDLSEDIKEKLHSDFVDLKQSKKKEFAKNIESSIGQDISNLKEKTNTLNKEVQVSLKEIINDITNILSDYYSFISRSLSENFNKEFKRIFNERSKIKFNFDLRKEEINFLVNNKEFTGENSKKILKLQEELNSIQKELNSIHPNDEDLIEFQIKELNKYIEEVLTNLENLDKNYKNKKDALGVRPNPTQTYKYVTKTRKKWLFFKEEYEEKVPDGLDYSKCELWDRENIYIYEWYDKEQNKKYTQKENYEKKIRELNRKKDYINCLKNNIKSLEEEINVYKKLEEKERDDKKKRYLDGKKLEIYNWLSKNYDNGCKSIENQAIDIINKKENIIKLILEKETEISLQNFEKHINTKINSIREKIETLKVDDNILFDLIYNIRDELKE
ncbi:dynamin family protein [Clostridium tarantellae]|uniref:Dynamin N-terminal domain-containing protein n=1 Tax=Clostridium tarantellae TaxID=39493 RepID=A0A6I1MGK6_9CLOT|nr:dynamin family protein [Clostridium tarantellae]MPQ42505.1 hypothetical protein [Clostridium tarantellae]